MKKIAIIGSGMAGLGAAYELSKNSSLDITIFEKETTLGGLSSSVEIQGEQLEAFYHHMFPTYYDLFSVARELGIEEKMSFKRAKSGIFYNNKIFPFDTPFNLLSFKPFSFLERIRTGIILAWIKTARSEKRFRNIGAKKWSKKYFGEKVYSILWEPLLESKFGPYADDVDMAWFWGRIYERPSKFGYFKGSLNTFISTLGEHLKKNGIKIYLGDGVENIKREKEKFVVQTKKISEEFDEVIIAAAPTPFLRLTSSIIPEKFFQSVSQFKYLGAICAILVLKHHLTDYYWTNINQTDFPFLGIIEQTNFVSPETYQGYHPVYLSKYLPVESDFYHFTDEEIWKQYIPALKKINKNFSEDWIKEKYIFRAPYAQPVITKNYKTVLPQYKTPVPGLWWISMSHVYPWDRGIDHAFHMGRELATEVVLKNEKYRK